MPGSLFNKKTETDNVLRLFKNMHTYNRGLSILCNRISVHYMLTLNCMFMMVLYIMANPFVDCAKKVLAEQLSFFTFTK